MTEPALERAIFFMIKTYLDSELITPEEVHSVLARVQEKVTQYNLQHH